VEPAIDFENFAEPWENVIELCQEIPSPTPQRTFWKWLCWKAKRRERVSFKEAARLTGVKRKTIQTQARKGIYPVEYRKVVWGAGGSMVGFVYLSDVREYNAMTYGQKREWSKNNLGQNG